jgi:hypothetical protein
MEILKTDRRLCRSVARSLRHLWLENPAYELEYLHDCHRLAAVVGD